MKLSDQDIKNILNQSKADFELDTQDTQLEEHIMSKIEALQNYDYSSDIQASKRKAKFGFWGCLAILPFLIFSLFYNFIPTVGTSSVYLPSIVVMVVLGVLFVLLQFSQGLWRAERG